MSDTLIDRSLVEVGTTLPGENVEASDSVSIPTINDTQLTASSADTPPTAEISPVTSTISENTASDAQATGDPSEVVKSDKAVGENISETSPNVPLVSRKHYSHSKPFFIICLLLLLLTVSGIFISSIAAFNYAMSAYTTYTTLRTQANDGVQHLLKVKTIFTGLNAHPTGFLDVNKLHLAQKEFVAAHKDFQQVQYTVDHAAIVATVNQYLPQYRSQITAARAVSQIGIDVAEIGQELVNTATILAPTFRSPILDDTRKSLVTPAVLDLVRTTIDYLLPRLQDVRTQSSKFSLNVLPINDQQRNQLMQLIAALPQAEADLIQVRDLLDAVGWMLGANEPRTFLVQTMDRAELRPAGGFTGQYGELSINGGRVAPFTLKDISLIEYVDNSPTLGLVAPPQYRSWWPFANWGLRDSNLSADFPTSAQIAISKYKSETKHQIDGVIVFTPFLVEHILQVIGPIQVPGYNDTITAQNLEERLHYYQQDNTGLAKQVVYQPGDKTTSSRKRFTALLAHLLIDRVRHAPPDEIIAIARQMLHDLKTKDLQVYVTNAQVEALLIQYGDAAQLDRSTTHDGLFVVQANVSASKASQFVRTILHDTVTLDAQGGVTHLLQMRLVYSQVGPVYGYDTYRDYVRIYVPATSRFLWGDGFDTGKPLCGATYGDCPQSHVYSKDQLVCPPGQFQPGASAPSIEDEDGGRWHPLDSIGPPPNLKSDEPGRTMFAGWVVVPKNCTMTVTLSWYVAPQAQNSPYSLLVQRQAGVFPELDLTILPTPGSCTLLKTPGQHFDGILQEDTSFSLHPLQTPGNVNASCYPQPGV